MATLKVCDVCWGASKDQDVVTLYLRSHNKAFVTKEERREQLAEEGVDRIWSVEKVRMNLEEEYELCLECGLKLYKMLRMAKEKGKSELNELSKIKL